jgi:hypothetical protein
MKYFEIHTFYDNEGYSVFVDAEDKDKAIQKAKDNRMFVSEHDCEHIDYVEEIDKDEYDKAMTLDKVFGMILGQWESC